MCSRLRTGGDFVFLNRWMAEFLTWAAWNAAIRAELPLIPEGFPTGDALATPYAEDGYAACGYEESLVDNTAPETSFRSRGASVAMISDAAFADDVITVMVILAAAVDAARIKVAENKKRAVECLI